VLDTGKEQLTINAPGASSGKMYIRNVSVNGVVSDQAFFNHFDLVNGGTIDFTMQDTPDKNWGKEKTNRPFSLSDNK
jgi:putative alpha-1,2-mannosidase